jgi:hypothetical protein
MITSRNKLYAFLITACLAGYIWIYYGLQTINKSGFEGCFIKQLTNIPCPSCGSTRSIILLMKGDFFEALMTNPLGYLIAVIMTTSPIWIIFDIITKNESFYIFYKNIEALLKKRKYALPLILIVIVNWIWNITKGL